MKKKLFLILNLIVMAILVKAQAPNAIPYQGVARNAAGNILASQPISLRVSIHDVTAAGTVVFSETHSATTTALGLFNVNIGTGAPVTGTLAGVDWGSGAKFIQVEFDPAGGSNYTDMGTTQLNSVPYALYAGNASSSGQWTTSGSDIYNSNSGHVGVGVSTPDPQFRLDVGSETFGTRKSSAKFAGDVLLDGTNSTFGTGWLGFRNTTNGVEWDVEGGPDYFTVGRSNVGYDLTIATNGNVGIGTGNANAPEAKLEVAGNIKINDGTQGTGKVLTSDANGVASWQDVPAGPETDPQVSNSVTNQVAKWDGSTLVDGLITDDGTNVGIGTNTPTSKLTIVKPLGNSLELLSGSNADWTAMAIGRATEEMNLGVATAPGNFMNGTEEGDAVIRVNDNTKKIVISPWVDNPTLVVTGTSVGIGNTTPTANLDVASPGTSGYAGQIRLNAPNMQVGASTVISNGKSNTQSNQAEWRFDYHGDASPLNAHSFGFNNVQPFVFFTAGSNVGIGTDNPAAKLDVAGNIKIADGTEGAGKVLTSDANGVANWQDIPVIAETDPGVSNTITNQVAKWDGSTLVDGSITDDGTNVGIGNTSPIYKLDVAAQSGVSARMKGNLILDGSDGTFGTGWIGFRNNTSPLEWDVEGSADYFTIGRSNVGYDVTIANNGNVGIGTGNTNAPAAKLEVAGDIKITDGTEGAGKVLTSDATGKASWQTPAISPWTISGDDISNSNIGHVGVGVTTPDAQFRLDVGSETFGTRKSSAKFAGDVLLDGSNSTFGTGWLGFRNTTNGTEWDVEGGPDYFTIGRSNVGYDVTIATNGNVGIGTGNANPPAAKLEIAGNVKIVDGTQADGKVLTSDANGLASWVAPGSGIGFKANTTAIQSIPSSANTVIDYPMVEFNDGNAYNDTTNTFTAPSAGVYQFDASIIVNGASGGLTSYFYLFVNGSSRAASLANIFTSPVSLNIGTTLKLNAGDQVSLQVFSFDANTTAFPGAAGSSFSGHKVY